MVNLKNVMSLSLVFSVILSASQIEAHKRSWEESFDDENFEAASAATRESPLLDPNEVEGEPYDDLEEILTSSPQLTIPRFLMPGFFEWWGSEDQKRASSDENRDLIMAADRTRLFAQGLAEDANNAKQVRLTAAAQAEVVSEDLQPYESSPYDDRDLIDILVENHLAGNWNLYPRSPIWPIMDPTAISEDNDEDNGPNLALLKIEDALTPGDSSANPSSRSPSTDFNDGDETVSDSESHNPVYPIKGRRNQTLKHGASDQFVKAYKELSQTFSGGALNRALMKELSLDRATLIILLDKARYDVPEIFKPAKRVCR